MKKFWWTTVRRSIVGIPVFAAIGFVAAAATTSYENRRHNSVHVV